MDIMRRFEGRSGHFCVLWGCFMQSRRDVFFMNSPQPRVEVDGLADPADHHGRDPAHLGGRAGAGGPRRRVARSGGPRRPLAGPVFFLDL